jgi:sugar phosphate isomerase/epimerase
MIRLSISNLAWQENEVEKIAPILKSAGMDGIELAPTKIWRNAPDVSDKQVRDYSKRWHAHGLAISGVQSLFFGNPEMQIFERSSWKAMQPHLAAMIRLAHNLGTGIVVFGSPKNRVRGILTSDEANTMFAEFLSEIIPVLEQNNVILSLEPNAPEYGADYLTTYSECVDLSKLISSPWVRPQIDTGCLSMVNDPPELAALQSTPIHVHVSAPNLDPLPGPVDHASLKKSLITSSFSGWIVLEMLSKSTSTNSEAIQNAIWLSNTYGTLRSNHEKE